MSTDKASGSENCSSELVVLVHGIAASKLVFWRLEDSMRSRGYATLNWSYPSIRGDIISMSESLGQQLDALEADDSVQQFHLVTHSMGSILTRAALASRRFANLGRVVMLCPPNRGSRVAANFSRFLGGVCKPLGQLSDAPDSWVNQLPELANIDIGIIAAARDRVVRIESTGLPTQADHIVVNSGHTSMLFRRDVAEFVESFLRLGRFNRES